MRRKKSSHFVEKKSITGKTIEGFFWMFSGKGINFFLQLLIIAILARLITPEEFGLVSASLVVISFSEIFSQVGIGPAIVQRPNLRKEHICTGFTFSIFLGVLFALIIYFSAPLIEIAFNIKNLSILVRILSLLFPIHGISVVARHILQKEMKFKLLAGAQVFSYIFGYLMIGVFFAYKGFGEWALIYANLSQAFFLSISLLILQPHPKLIIFNNKAFKELISFGGGFTLAKLFSYLALQGDNFVVGRWLGAGALGIYSRAYQLMSRPATFLGDIIDQVLFPAMSKVQNNKTKLTNAYISGISLIALTILPVSLCLFFLAPEIIRLILGPNWDEVIIPFQVLSLGMIFRSSYKVSDSITRAKGAVYSRAWRKGVYAFLVVWGSWLGQYYYDLPGVAIGVLIAVFLNYLLMAQLSLNLLNESWIIFLSAHIPAFILSLAIGLPIGIITFLLRMIKLNNIALIVIPFLIAFFIYLFLLWNFPNIFLGRANIWILEDLNTYIPRRTKILQKIINKIIERCDIN